MTQIDADITPRNLIICVHLRDLRASSWTYPSGSGLVSGMIYQLAASSIQHPASSIPGGRCNRQPADLIWRRPVTVEMPKSESEGRAGGRPGILQ
jgi:hypothetical protein